ncbi:MAG: pseudouridine synthase [Clostridia bacterium]
MIRINKYLASSGVCSRRNADKLIEEGRVSVNGKVVTTLGMSINENNDTVLVDGNVVKPETNFSYIMLYKPKGCVCTASDEFNRKTIFDYVDLDKRLFSIGRLDFDSEGLLLLTNDGDLAQRLTHPSYEIPKTYLAKIDGEIPESDLARIRKGVIVDGVMTRRSKIRLKEIKDNVSSYEITIYEGKNRQIRKMFEVIGYDVIFLKRVSIGDLRLGGLGRGAYRYLKDYEVEYLKKM